MGSHGHIKSVFCFTIFCTVSTFIYTGNWIIFENDTDGHAFVKYEDVKNPGAPAKPSDRWVDVDRNVLMQLMCDLYANKTDASVLEKNSLDHILVDTKHRLLYCYVPKVACTNWKRMFMILTKRTNTTDALTIPASVAHGKNVFARLSTYTWPEIEYFLETYTKFLFVRHPFERLLSAYRNKLEQSYMSSKYFQVRFGRHIVRHYRRAPSKESLLKGNDVTFNEFLMYVTNPQDVVFNEHWKPIYKLCEPCIINYNVIGKYESLLEDSQYILNTAGEPRLTFPHVTRHTSTTSQLQKYFSALPKELIWKLYDIYFMDFKLFGYSIGYFIDS